MVAFTLIEFSSTVMTGAVVSVDTTVVVASQMDVADRHTVNVEHLQQAQTDEMCVFNMRVGI